MLALDERRHLDDGARAGETHGGAGIIAVDVLGPAAEAVLGRAGEVVRAVLEPSLASTPWWPSDEEWAQLLPAWFVSACAPEQTPEEVARYLEWWRALDPEGRATAQRDAPWTLSNWLGWMEPAERQWWWWDVQPIRLTHARLLVVVDGWPAPIGALRWLLRCAGAGDVRVADDLA